MNYIIYKEKKFFHFYHGANEGIVLKTKEKGRWSQPEILCREGNEGFCVYADGEGVIHLLCSDKENRIIYLVRKKSEWNKYILSEGNEDVTPQVFKISKAGNILNFFYSATYQKSVILVHCVLGANGKPENIDFLNDEHYEFCLSAGKVYYTNKNKVLGYRDFSDSKPGPFTEIEKNAVFAYATMIEGKEYLVYKKDDFLFVNKDRTYLDAYGVSPVICVKDSRLTLQWQSGNFIRYLTSFNGATTWSSPMRFINNGEGICRFSVQIGEDVSEFYGQNLKTEPIIYGKSNLFFSEPPVIRKPTEKVGETKTPEDYKKMQILIDLQKREIKTLKTRIRELESSEPL